MKRCRIQMEPRLPRILQIFKEEVGRSTHSQISRLVEKVSCPCRCVECSCQSVLAQPYDDTMDHPNAYASQKTE
jgi:hypothetical protein